MEKNILGVWSLKDFLIEDKDGCRKWRENAHGILIYNEKNYMSVSINSNITSDAILDSMLFYSGTFEVVGDTVKHLVANATDPGRIGKTMIRKIKFDENKNLFLIAQGDFGTATLIWKKQH